jgi:hypothetical protein
MVICCDLHGEAATALGSVTTFALNVIESGDAVVHVPLSNVIVAEELLNTMPCRLNAFPTAICEGIV